MTRKIIQITSTSVEGWKRSESYTLIIALCDDGTLWTIQLDQCSCGKWRQVQPLESQDEKERKNA